jgi:hypothetical protein
VVLQARRLKHWEQTHDDDLEEDLRGRHDCCARRHDHGGLFGLAAGRLAPDFFRHLIPWQDVEPAGFAVLLGATAGVLLGGALGCFGVIVQGLLQWKARLAAEQ